MLLDYTRCGDESGQCVRLSDMCNGKMDCVNNWDESVDQCVTETAQNLFVAQSSYFHVL